MTQLRLFNLDLPKGRTGKVYALLIEATKEEPLSLLDLDRTVYGTSVDRLIRFFGVDAWKWGRKLCSEWRVSEAGARYKVYWSEER